MTTVYTATNTHPVSRLPSSQDVSEATQGLGDRIGNTTEPFSFIPGASDFIAAIDSMYNVIGNGREAFEDGDPAELVGRAGVLTIDVADAFFAVEAAIDSAVETNCILSSGGIIAKISGVVSAIAAAIALGFEGKTSHTLYKESKKIAQVDENGAKDYFQNLINIVELEKCKGSTEDKKKKIIAEVFEEPISLFGRKTAVKAYAVVRGDVQNNKDVLAEAKNKLEINRKISALKILSYALTLASAILLVANPITLPIVLGLSITGLVCLYAASVANSWYIDEIGTEPNSKFGRWGCLVPQSIQYGVKKVVDKVFHAQDNAKQLLATTP